ncbi:tRNA preQ1(34) S-adenosylmethionine ribosyltransferase-isomerase QueA [Terrihabitans rhizophilus]|uniref:S-adenosylmethionine:tRNA ribosyltransferase-isomerase n=1 Tax=Terrihabitans rhizophilus TaxID=3092662 RepID=A0ABU4RKD7_9HYPH|nr:tRNA preQ1(34) S-adenosylmethionine ribosyltransferase-isomerase QueA [Terrihabitans sp. PJ23]MDX6805313.1 tRNA preQ1(34) S-adenosylmethionine ribosyltransferase-isomerase QueA [Terrihabitans sp. PJ23]
MDVQLFDFDLPEERIALRPAEPRDHARMMVVRPGAEPEIGHRGVLDLPDLLQPGDALVVNDTRVIPAQLSGRRIGRGDSEPRIDATLHKRVDAQTWLAFLKPGRKIAAGDRISFGGDVLEALAVEKNEGGDVALRFSCSGPELDAAIAATGTMPLPPYIAGKRPADARDHADYQTAFAEHDGAVAAPTAGLHFTERLLTSLTDRGIGLHRLTLHVGAGTFLPMKAQDTRDHRMHSEWGTISPETAEALNAVRARGGRVVAVGTTALRLLESAATESGIIQPFSGDTDIFITPGYRFRAVDALMTNFHLPKSTLFMLVSAFAGLERMQRAYGHAIADGYRFYSYGDSSLLFPDRT